VQRSLVILLAALLLGGCVNRVATGSRPGDTSTFNLKSIAKGDIDMVAEQHINASLNNLRTLMEKLYRRNPREWRKGGFASMEAAVERIFANEQGWAVPSVGGKRSIALIEEAFRDDYHHDRVMALVAGLATMIIDAYGGKTELYLLDDLDPQRLQDAARNIEITLWRLGHRLNRNGEPYLLSNETQGERVNISFERLFGRLLGSQEVMAQVVANKTNRTIKGVIQRVAGAVLLPI